VKALSIRQPWAWMVVHGGKHIENRRWNTRFRGEFLIHAAKGMTRGEYADALIWAHDRGLSGAFRNIPSPSSIERGGIIGIARLVDVVRPDVPDYPDLCGRPWHMHEQFGFVLEDVRPLPFLPLKGSLGFFEVGDELARSSP
jgi:hypothetical protein